MSDKVQENQVKLLAKLDEIFGDEKGGWNKAVETLKEFRSKIDGWESAGLAAVIAGYDKLKADVEAQTEAIRKSKHGLYVPGIEDMGTKFSMLRAYRAIRTGDWSEAKHEKQVFDETRNLLKGSHNIGDDSSAGYFVPDQVIPDVIQAIYTKSAFVALDGDGETVVSVLDGLTGGIVKYPKFNGGLVAYWIGEEDEYIESQVNVGDVTLTAKKMGVLIRMTDAMKRFAGFGYERLLRKDMVKAAAKKLDWTIAYGSGSDNMPRGIIKHTGIKLFSAQSKALVANNPAAIAAANSGDWQGGEISFDVLEEMKLLLEEDDIDVGDSFRMVSAKRAFSYLKRLKIENYTSQTTGQPYLLGSPVIPDARLRELIGEFGWTNQIGSSKLPGASVNAPTTSVVAKHTDLFAGDMSNILLARWAGIEIEDDGGKGKGFTSDHTYMKLRIYADVGVREERTLLISPDLRVRA